jgi:hypothetical protein
MMILICCCRVEVDGRANRSLGLGVWWCGDAGVVMGRGAGDKK